MENKKEKTNEAAATASERPLPAALFLNLETKRIESLDPNQADPKRCVLVSDLLAY